MCLTNLDDSFVNRLCIKSQKLTKLTVATSTIYRVEGLVPHYSTAMLCRCRGLQKIEPRASTSLYNTEFPSNLAGPHNLEND